MNSYLVLYISLTIFSILVLSAMTAFDIHYVNNSQSKPFFPVLGKRPWYIILLVLLAAFIWPVFWPTRLLIMIFGPLVKWVIENKKIGE